MKFSETDRLIIRKFRDSDFEDFYNYAADTEMSRMMGRHLITDRESAMPAFLWLKDREPRGYVLELKETGKVIGNLTVTEPSVLVTSMPEMKNKIGKALSFAISRAYQRRGLMTEALHRVIRELFCTEQVDYVNCGYFDFNVASRELQKSLGFISLTTESVQENGENFKVIEQILWNPYMIRYAGPEDYDSVEAIMQEVHKLHLGWRPDIYKPADTIYPKEYFERRAAEKRILVAEYHGEVAGLLSFQYRHVESDKQVTRDVIFVDDLAVKEEYRGQGIGTRLLTAIKKKVQEEKRDGLELQVNARNTAAKEMYEKFGFREKSINMELL